MRRDITGQPTGIERPLFLVFFGSLGFAGCLALLAGAMIAPFFVPEYDWVSDTISDLAAGEHRRIMDFALYGFAAGLLATALATSHAHLGGVFWSAVGSPNSLDSRLQPVMSMPTSASRSSW